MPGIRGRGAAVAVVTAALLMLIAPSAGATGFRSTFDNGAEGWEAYSLNQIPVTHVPTQGNPGGHIAASIPDPAATTSVFFDSPPSWHGNRSSAYGGSISFDIHVDPGVTPEYTYVPLFGSGDPDRIQHNEPGEPGAEWEHRRHRFLPGQGWISLGNPAGELDIVTVLTNLESIGIGVQGLEPGEAVYLDNVVFAADVQRKLSIGYRGGKFGGKLKAGKCAKGQAVTVFRKKGGPDAKAGSDKTNAAGRYSVSEPNAGGKYYAVAKKSFENGAGNCLAATSKSRRVG